MVYINNNDLHLSFLGHNFTTLDYRAAPQSGIDRELNGGITDSARVIRDAHGFGIIETSETCEGWHPQGIEVPWKKVNLEWEIYGFLAGNLPAVLRKRFMGIQNEAMENARAAGRSPEMGDND